MSEAANLQSDLRNEARWPERRRATLTCRGKDWRALTVNLSCGGVMLAVETGELRVGDPVTVTFQLEPRAVPVEGIIRHARKTAWGSIVGVAFDAAGRSRLARVLASPLW